MRDDMTTDESTWTPATYRIARRNGDSDVTGVRCGVFSVGPSVEAGAADRWAVTHLPTGRRIGKDFRTEAEARWFVQGLALLRDDWPRVTHRTPFTARFRLDVDRLDRQVRDGGPSLFAEGAEVEA